MKKWPIVCILLLVLICFILLPETQNVIYFKLNAALLLGTFLALLWYASETHKMQNIMRHQIEVSIMPKFAMYRLEGDEKIELTNIGNGAGVNIIIEPIDISIQPPLPMRIEFPRVTCLQPRKSTKLKIIGKIGGIPSKLPVGAHLDKRYANKDWPVKIKYEDVLGYAYEQNLTLGKSGPYIGTVEKSKK